VVLQKQVSQTTASSGDTLTYTLNLTVLSTTANNVQVTDTLPANMTFVGFGAVAGASTNQVGQVLSWNWPSLSPGNYQVTYSAKVNDLVTGGTVLLNNAQLTYQGGLPQNSSVSVTVLAQYTVKVAVYNEAGELVKEIMVKRLSQPVDRFSLLQSADITSLHGVVYVTVKGTQIASWDGTNQVGDPVTNGKYYVKVDNVDSLGVVTSVSQLVMVSRSIARITVNIYNEAGEVVRHLFSYADDPNNNPLSDVQLSTSVIRPSLTGAPNGTVAITSSNGMTLIWDGKSDSGSIVTNGHYQVEVHSVDGTGGEQVITRGVVVRSGNTLITDGNVFAGPNILKEGVTSTLIQVRSSVNYTLTARLYNTAGEVVKQPVTGKTGSNQVTLDVNGMASGLYFVATDLTDSNGGFAGRKVTQIVVQH
jgi:uncharacterized repeat protein (TIGR01451 family)